MISEVHDGLEYKRLEVHMLLEIQYLHMDKQPSKAKCVAPVHGTTGRR